VINSCSSLSNGYCAVKNKLSTARKDRVGCQSPRRKSTPACTEFSIIQLLNTIIDITLKPRVQLGRCWSDRMIVQLNHGCCSCRLQSAASSNESTQPIDIMTTKKLLTAQNDTCLFTGVHLMYVVSQKMPNRRSMRT